MALDTYANLQTAVANWLDKASDTDIAARAPEFIALAEAQMNRRLRVRQMISRAEATFTSGVEFLDEPTGDDPPALIEPISLTLEISETDIRYLERLAPERLLANKVGVTTSGEPQFYAHVGTSLQLLPIPGQDYTGELTYYGEIPALSDTNTSNWLLAAYPDAYLYGALLQGAPYLIDDERVATWGGLFQSALDDIQKSNRVPAGKLRNDDLVGLIGRPTFDINRGW